MLANVSATESALMLAFHWGKGRDLWGSGTSRSSISVEAQKKRCVLQKSSVRGYFLCFPEVSQHLFRQCSLGTGGSVPSCGRALRSLPAGVKPGHAEPRRGCPTCCQRYKISCCSQPFVRLAVFLQAVVTVLVAWDGEMLQAGRGLCYVVYDHTWRWGPCLQHPSVLSTCCQLFISTPCSNG